MFWIEFDPMGVSGLNEYSQNRQGKKHQFKLMNLYFQSDIIHQSVVELIHSEDREHFKYQLNWQSTLTPDLTLEQIIMQGISITFTCFHNLFINYTSTGPCLTC